MIRKLSLGLLVLALSTCGIPQVAQAEFTATYTPLANSPQGTQTSWYGGAVTNDGKFIYGLGHSHNTNGNNSVYAYEPATNTHAQLFKNYGNYWRWDTYVDAAGKTQAVGGSGHWALLDPVLNATDYTFFGGPDIVALTNRNNHQQFYMPARNEWWVLAGTTFYQGGGPFAGRFDLATKRWANVSKTLGEFSAGMIAGSGGWVAANAATAVCKDLNTVVLFGGMNDKYGGVRMIEPNPVGPEPYRWASAAKPPIYQPAENVRENAVCVGDTVYFSTGQQRIPQGAVGESTPVPGPFWKFHVPTRVWTRLTDGPPGGYFPTLTYDSDAQALLYYGGGTGKGSKAMWAYDLTTGTWQDLTGTTAAPQVDQFTAGFIPGFGHIYKGGRRWDGTKMAGAGYMVFKVKLSRVGVVAAPVIPPPIVSQPPIVTEPAPILQCPAGCVAAVEPPPVTEPPVTDPVVTPPVVQPPAVVAGFTWTKIPLSGPPNSSVNFTKHVRIAQAGNGRVYTLGGDWNGSPQNTGHQEVYSFGPNNGDWQLEAKYCGTLANPTHWHTDEAGVAWDAKRGVFWKLAGTVYGPEGQCPPGTDIKAKVIQFNPTTKLWSVPAGFDQKNIGYVTNGVLDPVRDEMIQIVDKAAWHLNLETGQWKSYPLAGDVKRFTALTTRIGREVWFGNQKQFIESYNLDTHKLTNHGYPPWPTTAGYGTFMTANAGGKLVIVKATAGPEEPRRASLYDPAIKQWTVLDQGEGWGNSITTLGDGRIVLMGGGINGPEYHNKFVWVGTLN